MEKKEMAAARTGWLGGGGREKEEVT